MRALLFCAAVLLALGACGGEATTGPAPTAALLSPSDTPVEATPTPAPPATDDARAGQTAAVEPASPASSRVAGQTTEPTALAGPAAEAATGFPVPPDRDFFRLVEELVPGTGDVDRVVRRDAPTLEPGHRETFQLVDLRSRTLYESDFELRLVTPSAYWFIEDGLEVAQADLERSAKEFEEAIYPKVTDVFGQEWTPGVDGDPHLYVINANLRGVGGYYSAADEYPREIRPVSNEIEAIYINTGYLPIGSDIYSQVLAHELQHAVHWNADLSEETWVNEGLSELAVTLTGFPERSIMAFRRAGPTSLTHWPANDVGGIENYGAASMFMHYLTEHYGGRDDLRPLLTEAADGIPGINAYLDAAGFDASFHDVFRDWAVANLLDEDGSRFGYSGMSIPFLVYASLRFGDEMQNTTPQYSNNYVLLEVPAAAVLLEFDGETTAPLLPTGSSEGCWWSNKGDVIDSTLSTALDLRGVDSAALGYEVWYSIEEEWDFAYVEVSEDDGKTWTILETPLTSSEDPLNVSFGPGYTGTSDGWQQESLSLDRWAGQQIMIRFQYITDAAIHDHGLCLRNAAVSSPGGESLGELDWTANGFSWTNNVVRQDFIVQVVYEGTGAAHNRVLQVELDGNNRGEIRLAPDPDAKRIVAVIQPVAPSTRIDAVYTLRLEPQE